MSKVNIEQLSDINDLTEKATLHDDDLVLIEDSEDSYNKKKVKKSNLEVITGTVFNSVTVGGEGTNHVTTQDLDGNFYVSLVEGGNTKIKKQWIVKFNNNLDVIDIISFRDQVYYGGSYYGSTILAMTFDDTHLYVIFNGYTNSSYVSAKLVKFLKSDLSVVKAVNNLSPVGTDGYKCIALDDTHLYIGGHRLVKLLKSDLSFVAGRDMANSDHRITEIKIISNVLYVSATKIFFKTDKDFITLTKLDISISRMYSMTYFNNNIYISTLWGMFEVSLDFLTAYKIDGYTKQTVSSNDTYLFIQGNAFDTSLNFVMGYDLYNTNTTTKKYQTTAKPIRYDLMNDEFSYGKWDGYSGSSWALSKVKTNITGVYNSIAGNISLSGITGISNLTKTTQTTGAVNMTKTSYTKTVTNTTLTIVPDLHHTYPKIITF